MRRTAVLVCLIAFALGATATTATAFSNGYARKQIKRLIVERKDPDPGTVFVGYCKHSNRYEEVRCGISWRTTGDTFQCGTGRVTQYRDGSRVVRIYNIEYCDGE